MMKQLVLLRHGQTEANKRWLYCGSSDIPLNSEGEEELKNLREQGSYPDISGFKLYTSGLIRTEMTLKLLFGTEEGSPDHDILPDFCEIDFGEFEMKSYYELKDRESYKKWIESSSDKTAPGGEPETVFKKRVLNGLQYLLTKDENALVIAHGGPISAVMEYLFPDENKTRYDWQPGGGHGYLIFFDGGKPVSYKAVP